MIFMIPTVNLGVREMGFLFCNLHICLITLCQGDKFDVFALHDFGFARRHIRFSEF